MSSDLRLLLSPGIFSTILNYLHFAFMFKPMKHLFNNFSMTNVI